MSYLVFELAPLVRWTNYFNEWTNSGKFNIFGNRLTKIQFQQVFVTLSKFPWLEITKENICEDRIINGRSHIECWRTIRRESIIWTRPNNIQYNTLELTMFYPQFIRSFTILFYPIPQRTFHFQRLKIGWCKYEFTKSDCISVLY